LLLAFSLTLLQRMHQYHPVTYNTVIEGKLVNTFGTYSILGVSVRIVLTLAPQDFILQVPKEDNDKYRLTITEAVLHIPVATMTPEVYSRFERTISEKDASIYFR
jgi:hypothetical protein